MIEQITLPEKKGYKITCKRCGHIWFYAGNNSYCCTCPHCKTSIMIHKKILALQSDNHQQVSSFTKGDGIL